MTEPRMIDQDKTRQTIDICLTGLFFDVEVAELLAVDVLQPRDHVAQ